MIEKGIDFETIHYLKEPLSSGELKKLFKTAGLKPKDALRRKEPAYREHVEGKDLSDRKLIELMAQYPELIQRPIVVSGKKAVVARPVERLRELGIAKLAPAQKRGRASVHD